MIEKKSKFWAPGGPAGQCCLIGSLIWKYQKFCSQYWIDYSGLTINYSIMFDFNSLTETLHLEFTDCRKIELSWVDWLMCDSIKWLVLTFSGFVQLSKMWWGTKTCWLNDWSDWLRRGGGGALGQRGCGGAGYWLQVIQHFRSVMKLQISQFTKISTWRTVACECDRKLSLVHLDFLILQIHLRPCQRSRSVSVPWCCNRCQAYH